MLELFSIPYMVFAFIWNTLWSILIGVVSFAIGLVITVISVVGPYASLGMLFVSNEKETQVIMSASANPTSSYQISTPEDGEWFSTFFAKDQKVEKIQLKNNKIIFTFQEEKNLLKSSAFVNLNFYSIPKEKKDLKSLKQKFL